MSFSYDGTAYRCPKCYKWYLSETVTGRCLTIHSVFECCHYGDTEIPDPTPSANTLSS